MLFLISADHARQSRFECLLMFLPDSGPRARSGARGKSTPTKYPRQKLQAELSNAKQYRQISQKTSDDTTNF